MTEVVSEGKTFGFDKPKIRVHLVSFRLDDKHWQILTNLFELLKIKPRKDRMTDKMLMLIDSVEGLHKKILQYEKDKGILERKIKLMEKEKVAMEREARLKVVKKATTELKSKPIPQPRLTPKQRPKTYLHSIAFKNNSKPSISIKQLQKDDWVVCPDKDDWVRKSVECKQCGQDNFKKFSECWLERRKNPFSDLFKCSKPKPKPSHN